MALDDRSRSWGIVPAAGRGTRIQPLAFSKELLPVGTRVDSDVERPMAVSEHLVARFVAAGVNRLCFVISADKSDILEYFGGKIGQADVLYVVQGEPRGLCDAVFRALPFVGDDDWVHIGLPDTIWFPEDALRQLPDADFSLLLFPVERPELFDAVEFDDAGSVVRVHVKQSPAVTSWIWGAMKLRGRVLRRLAELWKEPERGDEYLGTLINAYIEGGGVVRAFATGRAYVDVGTVNGFREATRLLEAVKLLDRPALADTVRHPRRESRALAAGSSQKGSGA